MNSNGNTIIELFNQYHFHSIFDMKEMKIIYESQESMSFPILNIPHSHCVKIFQAINNYIEKNKWHGHNFQDFDISRVASLIIPDGRKDFILKIEKYSCNNEFSKFISVYNHIFYQIILSYVNHVENDSDKYFKIIKYDIDWKDSKYANLITSFVQNELDYSQSLIDNLYILLFFTFYIAFDFYQKKLRNEKRLKILSAFVLHVLPLVFGMYRYGYYSSILRDKAFYFFDNKKFKEIEEVLSTSYPSKKFVSEIVERINNVSKDFSFDISVENRKKGVFSAYMKTHAYNCDIRELWDLHAIRIILKTDDPSQCYYVLSKIEKGLQRWNSPKGYYDYILNKKKNNYQSIHVVFQNQEGQLVEVQIRTILMHYVAEFGSASHQNYKTKNKRNSSDPSVHEGKVILERILKKNNLTINDFIEYLKDALEYVPIEHYYEGIYRNKYNPKQIIAMLKIKKGMK